MTPLNRLDALPPPTKADAVYVELRGQILRGVLPAGSRLEQELLAESLGVSTTPLREALRRLEADHLVVRAAHRDVMIAPLSVTEARELYAVRAHLESLAIALAVSYMTQEELSGAEAIIDAPVEEASRYLQSYGIVHQAPMARARAFHHMVYSSSHNQVLIEGLDGLYARTERYALVARASRGEGSGSGENPVAATAEDRRAEHRAMLSAIADHDVLAAQSIVQMHDTVAQAVEQSLLGPAPQGRRRLRAFDGDQKGPGRGPDTCEL